MNHAPEIWSIGHSNLGYREFLDLLRQHQVDAIADVRTSPYSRHTPHFNRESLKDFLAENGISYAFLGKELGGRPNRPELYSDSVADYERMAKAKLFVKGIGRLLNGISEYRIAMMCSEHNPLDCHRCLLVGRDLHERGVRVWHILASGATVSQDDIEKELFRLSGKTNGDFFEPADRRRSTAYRARAQRVAFSKRDSEGVSPSDEGLLPWAH